MNILDFPKDYFQMQVIGSFLSGKDAGMLAKTSKAADFLVTDFVHRNLKTLLGKESASDLQAWVHKTVTEIVPGKAYEALPNRFLERYVRARALGEQNGRLKALRDLEPRQVMDLPRYAIEFAEKGFIFETVSALDLIVNREARSKVMQIIFKELIEKDKLKEAFQLASVKGKEGMLSEIMSGKYRRQDFGKILKALEAARRLFFVSEISPSLGSEIEDPLEVKERFSRFGNYLNFNRLVELDDDAIFSLRKLTLAQLCIAPSNGFWFSEKFRSRFRSENPLCGALVLEIVRKDLLKAFSTLGAMIFSINYPGVDENPLSLRLRELLLNVDVRKGTCKGSFLKVLDVLLFKLKEEGRKEDESLIRDLELLRIS